MESTLATNINLNNKQIHVPHLPWFHISSYFIIFSKIRDNLFIFIHLRDYLLQVDILPSSANFTDNRHSMNINEIKIIKDFNNHSWLASFLSYLKINSVTLQHSQFLVSIANQDICILAHWLFLGSIFAQNRCSLRFEWH